MSIILSLVRDSIPDALARSGYRQVARISGKEVVRIFGTRNDQLTLRREFCQKYGQRLLAGIRSFVVLGVSWNGGMVPRADTEADGISLHTRDTTWKAIAGIRSHPCADELSQYIHWKGEHSLAI